MVQIISRIGELPAPIEYVFVEMFADYREVMVQAEFTSGRSGSRVFLVRPIRHNAPELPMVVKIAHFTRIQQEWDAYQTAIQHRLPSVAEIRRPPTFPPGNPFGGLSYPLIGSGTFKVESFQQYYHHASQEDVLWVLEQRLFRSLETLWRQSSVRPDLHIQAVYDPLLPENLLIECESPPVGTVPVWLHPKSLHKQSWTSGQYIQFSGFRVVIKASDKQQIVFDMPAYGGFRFNVKQIPNFEAYVVGEIVVKPIVGVIKQTRAEELAAQVRKVFGPKVDITAETLTLPTGLTLPNPLLTLPQILDLSFDTKVSFIHGDLNLENIMVDPDSRTAQLIDFANSGRDHVLKDLIQLETAVLTKLLPVALGQIMAAPEVVCSVYERLHCATLYPDKVPPPAGLEKPFAVLSAIRRTAQEYLFERANWKEYYAGLTVYLLGCLKFYDLDALPTAPAPKQVAFWAAATVQKLLTERSNCETFFSLRPSQPVQTDNIDRKTTKPTPTPEEINRPVIYDRAVRLQLREALVNLFSEEELRDLCESDMDLDYDNLPGRAKPDKARELITYCERHNLTTKLVKACRRLRAGFVPF